MFLHSEFIQDCDEARRDSKRGQEINLDLLKQFSCKSMLPNPDHLAVFSCSYFQNEVVVGLDLVGQGCKLNPKTNLDLSFSLNPECLYTLVFTSGAEWGISKF